jgi:archaellum biogenesis protein FlaJ (TadC family)
VAVCNQITLLILYCVSSRLVTLLKVTDSSIQFSDILVVRTSTDAVNEVRDEMQEILLLTQCWKRNSQNAFGYNIHHIKKRFSLYDVGEFQPYAK